MIVYLESSACLRYLFGAEGAGDVADALREADRVLSSRLLIVEVERVVLRMSLAKQKRGIAKEVRAALPHIWARVDIVEVSRKICESAGRIAPRTTLRSLDAIHLATFEFVQALDPEVVMLTFDRRLLEALGR